MKAVELANSLGKVERTPSGFLAQCPAHDDQNPSLSISDADDGKILFKCHAGCSQEDVLSALKARNLWQPEPAIPHVKVKQTVTGHYEYYDHDGNFYYGKERLEPGRGGKRKDFRFYHYDNDGKRQPGRGLEPILYLELGVSTAKAVLFVEGEKQADLLSSWGLAATTLDSGAGSPWRHQYEMWLSGKRIVILPDNDEAGMRYAEMIAKALHGKVESLRIVELPGLPEKGDICDWVTEPGNDKKRLLEIIKAAPEWEPVSIVETSLKDDSQGDSEAREWPEPLLFGEIETPEIPTALLPSWLGDYAAAVSENTQTPPGLAVMMGLASVATCTQKRIEVAPYGDDYREPVAIWGLTGLPPASRKTAVKGAMTDPLTTWEREQSQLMADEIKTVARIRAVNLKRSELLTKKAAVQEDPVERQITIDEIERLERETPKELRPPRLLIDDVTPERTAGILVENGERAGLLSDEGGIFEIMAGLYSGGKANLNVFLQAHAGAPVRVDRQGRTGYLERPALSVGLTVQPDVISDLSHGGKGRFRGNGLLARFLYCIPRNNIGTRDLTRRTPIPASIKTRYQAGIYDLLSIEPLKDDQGRETPRILTLSPDALKAWETFAQYVESMQGPNGELESIQDWSGKLPGAALRIAGLFHVVEHGAAVHVINRQTIERSLDLCDILIPHAKAAFELMGDDQAYHDAKHVFQWIQTKGEPFFRQNEAHRDLRRFRQIDRLKKALRILSERHIISEPIERGGTGGRSSIMFLVNPELKLQTRG